MTSVRIDGKRHADRHRRHGSVTVFVLVCLLIVVTLVGVMLQRAVRSRRQLRMERNLRQTELLLQGGVERAVYRLTQEAEFRGETWVPKSPELADRAQVVTLVKRSSENESWLIEVLAEFPLGSQHSIRRSRTFHFTPSHKRDGD